MVHRHRQFPGPEPLPSDFSADLLRIDARLNRHAGATPPRPGMTDRIFAASVAMLPQAHAPAAHQPSLRLVPAAAPAVERRLLLHRTVFSRLALAACVGVACLVAIWLLQTGPDVTRTIHRVAINDRPATHAHVRSRTDTDLPMVSTEQWALNMDAAHAMGTLHVEGRVGMLLETSDLTLEDIASDLEDLGVGDLVALRY